MSQPLFTVFKLTFASLLCSLRRTRGHRDTGGDKAQCEQTGKDKIQSNVVLLFENTNSKINTITLKHMHISQIQHERIKSKKRHKQKTFVLRLTKRLCRKTVNKLFPTRVRLDSKARKTGFQTASTFYRFKYLWTSCFFSTCMVVE